MDAIIDDLLTLAPPRSPAHNGTTPPPPGRPRCPDRPGHLDLPESDGEIVKNFQEHPQSVLLTDSLIPVLDRLHPDGRYVIGQDSGIYWCETDPPLRGVEAPDWFYVPNVSPDLDGEPRRSYVLWQEEQIPLLALEFASRNGREERDATPVGGLDAKGQPQKPGKFWVYEQEIGIPYYGIFIARRSQLELYHLEQGRYRRLDPNGAGRYPIAPLGVELGLWRGQYLMSQPYVWLRWWDEKGNLLLTGQEAAAIERQRAESAEQRAETAEQQASVDRQRANEAQDRADRLAARLRELGIDPERI